MEGGTITASITFLGTGTGSYVVGRQLRGAGGIILRVDDNQFHIDPGVGALTAARMNGISIRENTAILVSQNDLYHANDINAVIDAMTLSGLDKKGVLIGSKTVMHGSDKEKSLLKEQYRELLERYIVLEQGKKVGINDIEIKALKTVHRDINTIGFKFFTPYFTLAYTSDTKFSNELVEEYKNTNILIINVPRITKKDTGTNLAAEDAIKLISKVNPRLAIITHFDAEMMKEDPLYQVREIQKQTNVQVIAAKDGMVINPLSYSVDKGQRTLNAFPKKPVVIEDSKIKESTTEEPNQNQQDNQQ